MRAALTPIEEQVYCFLLDYLAEHTFQPSVREIARAFQIPSTKSVTDLLGSLETKGYVQRAPGRSRGVKLLGFSGGAGTIPVPVMRFPQSTDSAKSADDYLTLDRRLVPAPDAFLVRVLPQSAPEFGIREGDLVLVHPSSRSRDGDPVVVRVGGAVLVRTMERRGATLLLNAPDGGEPLEVGPGDDYAVLGVLAGVIVRTTGGPG